MNVSYVFAEFIRFILMCDLAAITVLGRHVIKSYKTMDKANQYSYHLRLYIISSFALAYPYLALCLSKSSVSLFMNSVWYLLMSASVMVSILGTAIGVPT
jgi:hypothetical protein